MLSALDFVCVGLAVANGHCGCSQKGSRTEGGDAMMWMSKAGWQMHRSQSGSVVRSARQ